MSTMRGKQKGLDDIEFDYTAENVRPGVAPDMLWFAIPSFPGFPNGLSVIGLVGMETLIVKFAREISTADEPQPVALLVPNKNAVDFHVAVTLVGLWPDDDAEDVARKLASPSPGSLARAVREFEKLRTDPRRVVAPHPTEDFAKEMALMYMQQCTEAVRRGRH